MEPLIARVNKITSRRIRKQAAFWVTELHDPDRSSALEEKVRRWIAKDPRHAAAFALATETWRRSGGLPGYLPERKRPRVSGRAFAGMAVLCAAFISALYFLRDGTLVTGPGEQRTVELSDGTQVSLNANSRIIVQYDDRVRKLILANGEVLFNVVKHQPRPFVVVIGEQKVILPNAPVTGLKLLNPGERLRFADDATEKRDSPSIEQVLAWQQGKLIFDDTSLSEAAAEFNRYGSSKMTIDGPALGNLRVGGVFRIGDPSSFAQAMANAYHLRVIQSGNTIVLTDKHAGSR